MRAAYIDAKGGPDQVKVGEMPEPVPGPGEVRLRVQAAGVGPWDVKIVAGMFGEIKLPYTVGFEFAGIVDQLGEGVTGVELGEPVYGTDWHAGSMAEYRVAAIGTMATQPAKFTAEESVALAVAGCTSLEGIVERLRVQPGETVLITAAAGGVGTIAVQVAKDAGARVFAVAGKDNHDYVLALGAEAAFDYHDAGWTEQVRKLVPSGVDALFDCAGGDTLRAAFDAVKDGGRVVGIVYGGPDAGPRGISFERFSAASGRERLATLAKMADEGRLRVELEAELPLDQAREAIERVAGGHTRGKVVVKL